MKAATLKTYLDVHTWTGLGSGLLLFIAFYTGALTVFREELDAWDRYLEPSQAHQDYLQAQRLLDLAVREHTSVAANTVRMDLSDADHPGHLVRWFERLEDGSFAGHAFRLSGSEELEASHREAHLAGFIYRLHYTAGLPESFGLYVLGFVCVLYGLALVSGLLIFLPNAMRNLFVVRPGKNTKRFWLDTHNVVGVLSLPWHVMYAWSSALLAIGVLVLAPFQYLVYENDLQALIGAQLGLAAGPEPAGEQARQLAVADLVEIASRELPGLEPFQLRYENLGDANATVMVRGVTDTGTLSPFASVTLKATTGEVLHTQDPATAEMGSTFYSGLVSLHFASFGGYLARWLYFVLGLAGAFLFYSGNLLWIESRRKRRSPQQTGGSYFLARLNSGVCIGCMAAVSAAFLASRGFAASAWRAEMTEYVYFGVFFLSIAWCYLRPVAIATRDLLYLAALLSAAIPLVDLVLPGNSTGFRGHAAHPGGVIVDLMAGVAALAFWRMGAAVRRRALNGELCSVWVSQEIGRCDTRGREVQDTGRMGGE